MYYSIPLNFRTVQGVGIILRTLFNIPSHYTNQDPTLQYITKFSRAAEADFTQPRSKIWVLVKRRTGRSMIWAGIEVLVGQASPECGQNIID